MDSQSASVIIPLRINCVFNFLHFFFYLDFYFCFFHVFSTKPIRNSQKIAYCDLVLVCLSSAAKFGKALLVAASCPNPPNLVSDS